MSVSSPTLRQGHRRRWGLRLPVLFALACLSLPVHAAEPTPSPQVRRVPVTFRGGHETEPVDRGRPVALIAGALKVPPKVFREAFSHVRPAPGGREPEPQQVRLNKEELLSRLSQYGVTNQRLDTVSNYYRYRPQEGEMWPTQPAQAVALVREGKVTGFEVTAGGSGYNVPPQVSVPGFPDLRAVCTITFSPDFNANGSVASITLEPPPASPPTAQP